MTPGIRSKGRIPVDHVPLRDGDCLTIPALQLHFQMRIKAGGDLPAEQGEGPAVPETATQKGAWENDKKVYSLFVVNRDEIATQSKNVFSSFLSDISGRLLNTKEKLSVEGE